VWAILRKKQIFEFKFLRQHPVFYREDKGWVDFYIADFYCKKLRLIIEVDGRIHETTIEYDKERNEKLLSKGILVERIPNEITTNLTQLAESLNSIIKKRILYISNNQNNTTPSLIV
jgi:very-short-patch-repair endonuclease